jgi:heavy metal sensor kinase
MKSIRLSLLGYFLGLLGLALGAVSVLAYEMAHETLLEKREAARKSLEAQYTERCDKERAKFDDALLAQARTLAQVIQFQWPTRMRYRELYAELGLLGAPSSAHHFFLTPAWIAEGAHGPIGGEMMRNLWGAAEVKLDEYTSHQDAESGPAEYFQVDSFWGNTYRSPSLGGHLLPFDPQHLPQDQVFNWELNDLELEPGVQLRRVVITASPGRLFPPRGRGPRPPPNTPTVEQPQRPALVIQFARNVAKRDEALAEFKAQRDQGFAQVDEETNASLVQLRNGLLAISLVTFAAIAAGGLLLVHLGLAPLRRLSEAVSQVSEKDFRLPLEERCLPSELTTIVERLTQTLEMLKRAFAREKQAAADISHDLRTPLAALQTTIDVALRKPRSPEVYRETLEDCRASAQQMNRLVERLLTLARLDAGVDRLRPQLIDVAALAEQSATLVRPLAEARDLSLHVHHDGPVSATADPDKLREVLTNLLHNAIEYNRPKGTIDLTVARSNGHLELEVRDTGIGIAPDAQTQIFERFYRADPSRQMDGLHSGLGLAIVKGYVQLMGGRISVESAQGQGSTFRVELPAA